jgi:hypothetical protein
VGAGASTFTLLCLTPALTLKKEGKRAGGGERERKELLSGYIKRAIRNPIFLVNILIN